MVVRKKKINATLLVSFLWCCAIYATVFYDESVIFPPRFFVWDFSCDAGFGSVLAFWRGFVWRWVLSLFCICVYLHFFKSVIASFRKKIPLGRNLTCSFSSGAEIQNFTNFPLTERVRISPPTLKRKASRAFLREFVSRNCFLIQPYR